jgi:hypothetical protein
MISGGEDARTCHVGECVYVCLMQVNQVSQATLIACLFLFGVIEFLFRGDQGEIKGKIDISYHKMKIKTKIII